MFAAQHLAFARGCFASHVPAVQDKIANRGHLISEKEIMFADLEYGRKTQNNRGKRATIVEKNCVHVGALVMSKL